MSISKTTFRLTKLAMVIGVASMAMNAQAIYNLYKKDGFTLDINGQVDVQATKTDRTSSVLKTSDEWYFVTNGAAFRTHAAGTVLADTDKKTRLGQTHGVSFLDIRGSQILPYDWRVTGNIGLGYTSERNMYLSNSSLSLDKKNIGAITLGRQFLHTNYVNRTGTDTPLDIFSSSALRLDYYAPKGLHASAYYSFAGYGDVRTENNIEQDSGYGASLSYRFPMSANQSLRLGLGYTQANYNPVTNIDWIGNTLNRYPAKTQGYAGSLEYQVGKLLLAADYGQKKETMSASEKVAISGKTTDYLGAKIAYDITPVWQMSVGYGVKKANTTLKHGRLALSNDADGLWIAAVDAAIASGVDPNDRNAINAAGRSGLYSYVSPTDRYLFDRADSKEMYIQTDYRIRPNVRLYGRYDTETTTYKLGGENLSRDKDNNIRAGIVFTF